MKRPSGDHLALKTIGENVAAGRQWLRGATHCQRGHLWTEESTRWSWSYRDNKPRRTCEICRRQTYQRRKGR